ncbi:MAG: lipoyl synthase [Bacteroidetes bacterium]|nr:lipoyl synthase [Bacteroidota bacterium]
MIELPVIEEKNRHRKPKWLKIELPKGEKYRHVKSLVKEHQLHTICEDGQCPNMGECWGEGTATFMILGNVCTRSCSFCAVATGRPQTLDTDEPQRVAEAVRLMEVKHCVLTSVNRDELPDGGAQIWADTIIELKTLSPQTTIEVLIPDFKANWEALQLVVNAKPEVISHNMETVEELYRKVRPQAKYQRSLDQILRTKNAGARTKSGFMVGLGETEAQVIRLMEDLHKHGLDVLTIGQYLQPTHLHLNVEEYITPEQFKKYEDIGYEIGFDYVESGPLVRSSYHSERHVVPQGRRKPVEA